MKKITTLLMFFFGAFLPYVAFSSATPAPQISFEVAQGTRDLRCPKINIIDSFIVLNGKAKYPEEQATMELFENLSSLKAGTVVTINDRKWELQYPLIKDEPAGFVRSHDQIVYDGSSQMQDMCFYELRKSGLSRLFGLKPIAK